MQNQAPPHKRPWYLLLTLLIISATAYGIWTTQFATSPCDPKAAKAKLKTLKAKGIRNTGRGSSLTNLLWIYVDQQWYALPMEEKLSIDKVVSCAATRLDDQGHPTWQAAYYDHKTGKLAALTSQRYGFRLKADESSNLPGWNIP